MLKLNPRENKTELEKNLCLPSLRPPASRFICFLSLCCSVSHKKHERDDEAKFGSCLIIQHHRCTFSCPFCDSHTSADGFCRRWHAGLPLTRVDDPGRSRQSLFGSVPCCTTDSKIDSRKPQKFLPKAKQSESHAKWPRCCCLCCDENEIKTRPENSSICLRPIFVHRRRRHRAAPC